MNKYIKYIKRKKTRLLSVAIELEMYNYIKDISEAYEVTISEAVRMVLRRGMGE